MRASHNDIQNPGWCNTAIRQSGFQRNASKLGCQAFGEDKRSFHSMGNPRIVASSSKSTSDGWRLPSTPPLLSNAWQVSGDRNPVASLARCAWRPHNLDKRDDRAGPRYPHRTCAHKPPFLTLCRYRRACRTRACCRGSLHSAHGPRHARRPGCHGHRCGWLASGRNPSQSQRPAPSHPPE